MKRHARHIIYIVVIAAALCIIALFLQDTPQTIEGPAYRATAPTEAKFAKLSRWIPADIEFDITVDVSRALANPFLKEKFTEIADRHTGVAAELIGALLKNDERLGLITITGMLGDKDTPPELLVIAQGQFDEKEILPAIRAAMSENRAGISARDLEWATMYYESDKRDPFGFILLDDEHMAVGEKETLEAFFLKKPETNDVLERMSEDVLFGRIKIKERMKNFVPKMVIMPDSLDFSSKDGAMLTAHVSCEDPYAAESMRMFLEGMRSLMMIQHEHNMPLISILDMIDVTSKGKVVTITTKLAPLLNLWSSEPPARKT